jgi:glucose/arabinose dehydrogenase
MLAAACGGDDGPDAAAAPIAGTPDPAPPLAANPALRATNAFANLSFTVPTSLTHAGDGSNRLFVTEKQGVIRVFDNRAGVASADVFIDLRPRVDSSTDDAGLLGIAFDPAYRSNGHVYISWVTLAPTRKLRVSRFTASAGNRNALDVASERVVYEYDHARDWHYGGWLAFGRDGMLYLSTGDNIRDAALQDVSSPYGKVLRMRINAGGSYSVPPDNPFGTLTWAMGFRNPWRCSFDRANGDLWCGDVGEDNVEEINFIRRGAHYGWDWYEGDRPLRTPAPLPYTSYEPAVHRYDHSVGISVIGGYVYRGQAHPWLVGRYLYADFASGNLWAIASPGNGQFGSVDVVGNDLVSPTSFGEDEAGEVYVVSVTGRILRLDAVAAMSSVGAPAGVGAR